ncbi:MAG: hypothetical protein E7411_05330 [Ruminococcaceae bacterium]|nr:hypothetical protein [Oscillospiraceae bacterium]
MKKKKMKRNKTIIALWLLACMCLSVIPIIPANAQMDEAQLNPYPIGEGAIGKIAVSKTATLFHSGMENIIAKGNITKGTASETHSSNLSVPTIIDLPEHEKVLRIESGHHHQLFLTESGKVYAMGNNEFGQLGNNMECEYSTTPILVEGLNDIVDISADGYQSFAVARDGILYGWGRDQYSQVYGSGTYISTPMEIAGNVRNVEAGVYATYYIDNDWNLYSKGYGTSGLLGYDFYGSNPDFLFVRNHTYDISAGINHVIIWDESGQLTMWGDNQYGQIPPVNIPPLEDMENLAVKIGAGGNSSFVIYENGDAYVWGDNRYGQLGLPEHENVSCTLLNEYLGGCKIYDLSIGEFHGMALTDDGLYLFGRNVYNQVSSEDKKIIYAPINVTEEYMIDEGYRYEYDKAKAYYLLEENEPPEFVYPFNKVNSVTGATKEITEEFIITDESGNIVNPKECISQAEDKITLCFYGENTFTFMKCLKDMRVFDDINIKCDILVKKYGNQVETGLGNMYFSDKSNMYAWGNNSKGQLGIDVEKNPHYPVKTYTDISGETVDIKSGYYHTLVLTKNGKVYSSGQNTYGQLGTGNNDDSDKFALVSALGNYKVTDISANGYQSYAVTVDNKVFAWGRNQYDQLGDGTSEDSSLPVEITDKFPTRIIDVEAGEYCAFARDINGNVYGWGYNTKGNLGNGTLIRQRIPVLIADGYGIKQISAGKHHAVALNLDEKVYAWGYNDKGQITSACGTVRDTPKEITDMLSGTVKKVTAKGDSTLILNAENELYVLGDNSKGQLGLGNTGNITALQKLNFNKNIYDIALSQYNMMILTEDNKIYIAGNNSYGQLGELNTSGSSILKDVSESFKGILKTDNERVNIVVSTAAGESFNVYLTVDKMTDIKDNIFKVTYSPEKLTLQDACIATYQNETTPGKVNNTYINILSHSDGVLEFKYDYNISSDKALSGWINGLKFKGNKNASSEIEVEITKEESEE